MYLSTTKQDIALGSGVIVPCTLTSLINGYLPLREEAVVPFRLETE